MNELTAIHTVTFEHNTRTGMWRASCPCFWCWIGTEEDVRKRADTHATEWEPVEAKQLGGQQ